MRDRRLVFDSDDIALLEYTRSNALVQPLVLQQWDCTGMPVELPA